MTLTEHNLNRTSVKIYGQLYQMVGVESVAHMKDVAVIVDEQMQTIRKANPSLDTTKLAVLTAVNAVNDAVKLAAKLEKLERQLQKSKDDVND